MKSSAYYLFIIIIQTILAECTITLDSGSLLQKPLLYAFDINPLISPSLYKSLAESIHFTMEVPVSTSSAMQRCTQYAAEFCNGLEVQRIQVGFNDSNRSWLLCKCAPRKPTEVILPGVEDNWTYLLTHLARIPVPLREYIDVVVSIPLETLGAAASSAEPPTATRGNLRSTLPHGMMSQHTVVLFGEPSLGTWIHEAAHGYSGERFSSSVRWRDSIRRDTCIADPYSRTSTEEAFAQTVMLKAYLQTQQILGKPKEYHDDLFGDFSCMKHQLDAIDELFVFGRDCKVPEHSVPSLEAVQTEATWWELWVITSFLVILFMLS